MEVEGEPNICSQCLGDESQVRMTKVPHGAACKICTIPFTLYHFRSSSDNGGTIKTLLCSRCAKQRNVCQCCMLDLRWNISVELRDQVVSLLQGTDESTTEASNEMAKRFLSLKTGKLGGARFTGEASKFEGLMEKLRNLIESGAVSRQSNEVDNDDDGANGDNNNEGHEKATNKQLLRLPFEGDLRSSSSLSFFIYGVEQGLAEWEIVDAVSMIAGTYDWQDRGSVSVVIRHEAGCGGIRFKTEELAKTFVSGIEKHVVSHDSKMVEKGVIRVRHLRMHVVAWPGFHVGALGSKRSEWVSIRKRTKAMILRDMNEDAAVPLRKQQMAVSEGYETTSVDAAGADTTADNDLKSQKKKISKVSKKRRSTGAKRADRLEL